MFCDLVGSTALASDLGDAAADDVRHDVFGALRAEITAYRGTEVKNLGDALMLSFASNNDAVRATSNRTLWRERASVSVREVDDVAQFGPGDVARQVVVEQIGDTLEVPVPRRGAVR